MERLERIRIRRIIGPTPQGAAVLVGNEKKTFAVFVGPYEAAAMVREINKEKLPRPLTHDLLQSFMLGFGVRVKRVIVSNLKDQTYFATLILEKGNGKKGEEGSQPRNEVRIDARPSDCFVLALKNNSEIYVTSEVFSQVEDVSSQPPQFFGFAGTAKPEDSKEIVIPDGLGEEWDKAFGRGEEEDKQDKGGEQGEEGEENEDEGDTQDKGGEQGEEGEENEDEGDGEDESGGEDEENDSKG